MADKHEQLKKRQETSVQIRKNKKNLELNKRRNIIENEPMFQIEECDEISQLMCINDENLLTNLVKLRKLLSSRNNKLHEISNKVIKSEKFPIMVSLLYKDFKDSKIKFEIAWIITNISAGTRQTTLDLLEHGTINALIFAFTNTTYFVLKEQIIWAFGNIYSEKISEGLETVYNLITGEIFGSVPDLKYKDLVIWAFSNVFYYNLQQSAAILSNFLMVLKEYNLSNEKYLMTILKNSMTALEKIYKDKLIFETTLNNTIWIVYYISQIMLVTTNFKIPVYALSIIFTECQSEHHKLLLETNVLYSLKIALIIEKDPKIIKDIFFTISNITATINFSDLDQVLNSNILENVFNIEKSAEQNKEAFYIINNFITNCNFEQFKAIININPKEFVKIYKTELENCDNKCSVLTGIKEILSNYTNTNSEFFDLLEYEIKDLISDLYNNCNSDEELQLCETILEEYFD